MGNYMTKKQVQDWANNLPKDARLCNNCLTEMREVPDDEGKIIYCPNELCDDDAQYRVS